MEHQRLGKPTALAVFASDNLSSSAYATEEILHVLVPLVGLAAFSLVVPITARHGRGARVPDPLATARRSRSTRRPAAPTWSPATTSASSPPRSPARRCSPTTSSPSRCRRPPAPPRSCRPSTALGAVQGADRLLLHRARSPTATCAGVKESGQGLRRPDLLLHRQHGRAARHRPRGSTSAATCPWSGRCVEGNVDGGRRPGGRCFYGAGALRRAPRLRVRRRRRHRCRGDLQRRARVPRAGVEERPPDPRHDGHRPRRSCSSACRSSPPQIKVAPVRRRARRR